MQTSLGVARDRLVGVLLGLFVMWVVFDRLWGSSAATAMRSELIATLRLLAQLIREPGAGWRQGSSDVRSDRYNAALHTAEIAAASPNAAATE